MTAILLLLAAVAPAQPEKAASAADEKQIAVWVADLSARGNYSKQKMAYEALFAAGPKAKAFVPELIKLLRDQTAPRDFVADILGAIGPDAKAAVPLLIEQCKPRDHGYDLNSYAIALVKIDSAKPQATRALLLSSGKGAEVLLDYSIYLRSYPAQVIPHLIDLCGDKDPVVRRKAATVLGEFSLRFPHPQVKPLVIQAGDAGKPVPALLEKLLADDDINVRLTAAHAIAQVAPERAEKTIPVVVAVMTDKNLSARLTQFHPASEIFRPVPEQAAKALIPLFDSPNNVARDWAINTLSAMTLKGPLEAALKDGKTARSRQAAAIALGSHFLYSNTPASETALQAALKDPEFIVRFAAANSLVQLDPYGKHTPPPVIPVLIEGLKQGDDEVRSQAGRDLGMIGPKAKAAAPELKRLIADSKSGVALSAALALVEIAPADAADAVPVLVEAIKTGGEAAALRLARPLIALGPLAKPAVPELVKRFDSKSPYVRRLVAEAAARIDPQQSDKAAAVLLALIQQHNAKGSQTEEALKALARIGPAAKSALPYLRTAFASAEKLSIRIELALAFASIDPAETNPAVVWIKKEFATNGQNAEDLAGELAGIGPLAKPFIPDFQTMLKSKADRIRRNGIEALAAIGPDAKTAIPELEQIAKNDRQPDLRASAAEAIRKIEKK